MNQEVEDAREQMRRLQELTVALLAAIDTRQVIEIFVRAGRDALQATAAFAWTVRDEVLELTAYAMDDETLPDGRYSRVPLAASTPMSDVARTGKPMIFETRQEMLARYPDVSPEPLRHGSWVIVPITVGGAGIGSATFSFESQRTFSEDDRELLTAMSNQASLAFERSRLHEAHQRSEEQLRLALSAARVATWSLDIPTMKATRDPSYRELVGSPEVEVQADFMAIHPEDRAIAREAYERAIRDHVPYEPVVRIRRGDGTYFWIQAHARVTYAADGTPASMSGVIVDIDEMKRASLPAEENRRINETMHRISAAFVGELDHDRLVQRIIDELVAVIGADSGMFYPGETCAEPEPGASTFEVALVTPGGETVGHLHFRHHAPTHFTEQHQRIVVSVARQAAMALENARLYTSLREHKEALEQAVERALLADRRKDEFLAMLGHELRNPLAPIMTALELIDLKEIAGVRKEREVIRRQVMHLSRLLDDLLDVSRITRGKIQLAKETVEVSTVLTKAIEMASPLLERRFQHLDVVMPRDALIDADATRLAQVFQNLLTNASKYSDPKSRIEVRTTTTEDTITVSVLDQGIGIAPELQPRLFEMFVQGTRAIDRAEGGLGIGLTIARSLTELHGGTIAATSDGVGHGSTFTVTLPRSIRPRVATEAMQPLARPRMPGARVLVVDDNVDAALMLREMLSEMGHELVVAHDGPSALELAASFKPDICVLDIGLPVMSGYELALKLREQRGAEALRLIAVTGYGQESDRAKAREVGFDHHLIKPIELDALLALLAK